VDVVLDRPLGDREADADLLVREAVGDELERLDLPPGEGLLLDRRSDVDGSALADVTEQPPGDGRL